ncbi:hypothetical protein CTAM01_08546 [Colletotrichum tamarilloi]|uniref:Uncharacterized protein n=1 Tax=Colletotrichum tamarilloi TaxID=1209934 RepID=A0ABQ9R5T2_9PEZI|nr:uncharacterized protein CTAM01_08546 [Colletotrichum tamarilloi]KAK1495417.1 hypothetical protein CTAM01_08546 [Colletotrichum tamarilloi]
MPCRVPLIVIIVAGTLPVSLYLYPYLCCLSKATSGKATRDELTPPAAEQLPLNTEVRGLALAGPYTKERKWENGVYYRSN